MLFVTEDTVVLGVTAVETVVAVVVHLSVVVLVMVLPSSMGRRVPEPSWLPTAVALSSW